VWLVLLERQREDEDIVQAGKAEVASSQNVVHKALKRLGGVEQAEGHEGELEKAEWSGNGRLLYINRMDGDLVVRSHQVDLGEDGTPEMLVGVIVYMTNGVAVWDYPGPKCPVVAARAPTGLSWVPCEGRRPGTF
jgi:hypothetical protein